MEEIAEREGTVVDRNKWRLVIPMYIAETREQAFDEAREGWRAWQIDYFRDTLQAVLPGTAETPEGAVETGGAIIGTPDDAIKAIEILQENSGGFGGLMMLAHEWANREGIRKSYELFARYVAPKFQGQLESVAWNPSSGSLQAEAQYRSAASTSWPKPSATPARKFQTSCKSLQRRPRTRVGLPSTQK